MPETASLNKITSARGLTALVAGGAGFLGSHLCETLLAQNVRVIALDNLEASGKDNIKHLLTDPQFTLVDDDLNNSSLRVGEVAQLDYIFHVAGVEEKLGEDDLSLETLLVNSLGTKHLLDLAKLKKAKFLLVSSADIYSGALSSTSLNYYFGRYEREEKVLTHHEAKRYAEALTFEYFKKYNVDARICRVLDVYGPRVNLTNGGTLNTLLREALTADQLTVEGDGLKTLHPTYVADVVFGLVKAMLLENTRGKIFHLVNPDKVTVLNLVEHLRGAFTKNYDILFTKEKSPLAFPYHTLEVDSTMQSLNWRPKVDLQSGLIKTAASFKGEAFQEGFRTELGLKEVVTPKPHSRINFRKWVVFPEVRWGRKLKLPQGLKGRTTLRFTIFLASFALILLGVIYPLMSFLINLNSGQFQLKKTYQLLQSGRMAQAKDAAAIAEQAYRRSSADLQNLNWLLTLFGQRANLGVWDQELFALQNLAKANLLTLTSLAPLQLLLDNYHQPYIGFADEFTTQIGDESVNLALAADRLAVCEATLVELQRRGSKKFLTKDIKELEAALPQGRALISSLRDTYSVLPLVLGFSGPKHYLLVETGMPLRSSGGVLKNYLLLTAEKGTLKKSSSGSFGSLDQTGDTISTPAEIKELAGKATLPLSESIWDLDLPTATKTLQTTFAKKGQTLSGVIFLDADFMNQAATKLAEPVKLEQLLEMLKKPKIDGWGELLGLLRQEADQKHAALVSLDAGVKPVLAGTGWGGEIKNEKNLSLIKDGTSLQTEEVADYLKINTDYFGTSSLAAPTIKYELNIGNQGLLEAGLTLVYENTSNANARGYNRVLVPLGSVLESRQVNGASVIVDQKFGKTQFGFPLEIKAGEKVTVRLDYQIPLQVPRNIATTYSLLLQKQLGTQKPPFELKITVSGSIEVGSSNGFAKNGNSFSQTGSLETDKIVWMQLRKT